MTAPLHVLVIDDSAVVRQALATILTRDGGTRVTVAPDPIIAQAKIARDRPDVVVLDLEMPRMHGLTFLQRLMAEDPLPVVVCSSAAVQGAEAALRALQHGAVEVVAKPRLGVRDFLEESAATLIAAVRAAAGARVGRLSQPLARPVRALPLPSTAPRSAPLLSAPGGRGAPDTLAKVVAIGASTGGPEALRILLSALPPDVPGIVIVQHMPEFFTAAFARSLDAICAISVKEAENGDAVTPGRALVAPGNRHLLLRRTGQQYVVQVDHGPAVSHHRPSVDVLFRSVAEAAGPHAVGVIMTGMGDDGAAGLLDMRHAGAATLAQDDGSCIVFGMPRAAIERGAAGEVVPLQGMSAAILRAVAGRALATRRGAP